MFACVFSVVGVGVVVVLAVVADVGVVAALLWPPALPSTALVMAISTLLPKNCAIWLLALISVKTCWTLAASKIFTRHWGDLHKCKNLSSQKLIISH